MKTFNESPIPFPVNLGPEDILFPNQNASNDDDSDTMFISLHDAEDVKNKNFTNLKELNISSLSPISSIGSNVSPNSPIDVTLSPCPSPITPKNLPRSTTNSNSNSNANNSFLKATSSSKRFYTYGGNRRRGSLGSLKGLFKEAYSSIEGVNSDDLLQKTLPFHSQTNNWVSSYLNRQQIQKPISPSPQKHKPLQSIHHHTIIVVDSDIISQNMLKKVLETHNFNVETAKDEHDIFDLIPNIKADLIILSFEIPRQGLELLKNIRLFDPSIPIIVIVSNTNDNEEMMVSCFDNFASDYIVKPFRKVDLFVRIKTQIELYHAMKHISLENKENDHLLNRMLPPSIINRLRQGTAGEDGIISEIYENVSVLFADLVDFTPLAASLTPHQVVSFLNHLYSQFDRQCENLNVYKVETTGDEYMAVVGAPSDEPWCSSNHINILKLAKFMLNVIEDLSDNASLFPFLKLPYDSGINIRIRIGIHTGPCAAGVVGYAMPHFCFFGDTINTASRMQSTGVPNSIQVSSDTYELFKNDTMWLERGNIDVKGKGTMFTYLWHNHHAEDFILKTNLSLKPRSVSLFSPNQISLLPPQELELDRRASIESINVLDGYDHTFPSPKGLSKNPVSPTSTYNISRTKLLSFSDH